MLGHSLLLPEVWLLCHLDGAVCRVSRWPPPTVDQDSPCPPSPWCPFEGRQEYATGCVRTAGRSSCGARGDADGRNRGPWPPAPQEVGDRHHGRGHREERVWETRTGPGGRSDSGAEGLARQAWAERSWVRGDGARGWGTRDALD